MASPFLIAPVRVSRVERLSPSFARIEFAADALAELGPDGPILDQRMKLIFPAEGGGLPDLDAAPIEDWYRWWLDLPDDRRGVMRTYSLRDRVGEGTGTRLVVDFVLHLEEGLSGPAARWADRAGVGDTVILVGPRRGAGGGGIEFAPGEARRVLLAGDETAVPAVARILEDLPADASGAAFLEVPHGEDALGLKAPAGVEVTWLAREGLAHGDLLVPAVASWCGTPGTGVPAVVADEVPDDVWETPTYSSSGEEVAEGPGHGDLYAWIAGESGVVTTLRRALVNDAGLDRAQVAFMGYWRKGVAMKG